MSRFFLTFLIIFILASCNPHKSEIKVCGQIHGYENSPVSLYNAESIYMNRPFEQPIKTVLTNEQGEFCFKIQYQESIFFHLLTENDINLIETPILANLSDSIYIETSIFNTSRPEFSGSNSSLNHFHLNQRQSLSRTFRYNRVNEWNIDEFVAFCDSIQQSALDTIDSISNTKNINPKGIDLAKADMLLFIAAKKLEYLQQHINETQGKWRYLIPSNSFYNFKENLVVSTKEYWFLPSFSMAVDALLEDDYQHIPQVIENPVEMHPHMLGAKLQLIETKYSGITQEVALAQIARNFNQFLTSHKPFIKIEKADSVMQVVGKKTALINYFNTQVDKVSVIKPGNFAPNFTLPNEQGQIVSLDDLKGKVVLLIFWGTWCPPCLAAMPKYIEIQERFTNQNIAFVFISLEARADDVQEWRKFVAGQGEFANRFLNGKPFPGVHLVAQGQFKNPQVQPYAITYAPSYVLVDRNGKIEEPRVNFDDKLIEQIELLLQKD
ncbi:MAG: hypothetical protein CVT98_08015 [Bacteroidetes bacterium HGW-Bacteroidetes-15]|nr:MAG: hypothetical protein CVT98_08015 [Bacteroidetes bacterium HGW-Bacteroidetes-15]